MRIVVVLVLLSAAAGVAWVVWDRSQAQSRDALSWQQENAELRSRIEALDEALDQLRRGQQAGAERIDAAAATNRVLREEILGMGERAALLEDAVARLADQRLRGETVLRLNEAEFLLLLGAERLRLFGDPASATQAFVLAEASLGSLDDPALATLRQTLAQELIELRSVPPDPRPQLRAELSALSGQLETLPASRAGEIAVTDARDSRLAQLLSQLVTVRHVSERDAILGPVHRDAALAAVRLQLELAQAALARPDPDAFHTAIAQVRAASERLFDQHSDATKAYVARLDTINTATLMPEFPALGATLQELRGLRATRTVGRGEAAGSALLAVQDPASATTPALESGAPAGNATPAPPVIEATPRPQDNTPAATPAPQPLPDVEPDVERAPTREASARNADASGSAAPDAVVDEAGDVE